MPVFSVKASVQALHRSSMAPHAMVMGPSSAPSASEELVLPAHPASARLKERAPTRRAPALRWENMENLSQWRRRVAPLVL